MKPHKQSEETGRHLWGQVLILPLCVCLVLASSATHPVWSVGASEDEGKLERLKGKKIHAVFKNYGFVTGQVKEVQDDTLRIDVSKSFNPRLISTGIQNIPIERISNVRWTAGSRNRKLFFTVGLATGVVAGLWLAGSGANVLAFMGTTAGRGLLGYMAGWGMDQKSITLVTPQPKTGGAPRQ